MDSDSDVDSGQLMIDETLQSPPKQTRGKESHAEVCHTSAEAPSSIQGQISLQNGVQGSQATPQRETKDKEEVGEPCASMGSWSHPGCGTTATEDTAIRGHLMEEEMSSRDVSNHGQDAVEILACTVHQDNAESASSALCRELEIKCSFEDGFTFLTCKKCNFRGEPETFRDHLLFHLICRPFKCPKRSCVSAAYAEFQELMKHCSEKHPGLIIKYESSLLGTRVAETKIRKMILESKRANQNSNTFTLVLHNPQILCKDGKSSRAWQSTLPSEADGVASQGDQEYSHRQGEVEEVIAVEDTANEQRETTDAASRTPILTDPQLPEEEQRKDTGSAVTCTVPLSSPQSSLEGQVKGGPLGGTGSVQSEGICTDKGECQTGRLVENAQISSHGAGVVGNLGERAVESTEEQTEEAFSPASLEVEATLKNVRCRMNFTPSISPGWTPVVSLPETSSPQEPIVVVEQVQVESVQVENKRVENRQVLPIAGSSQRASSAERRNDAYAPSPQLGASGRSDTVPPNPLPTVDMDKVRLVHVKVKMLKGTPSFQTEMIKMKEAVKMYEAGLKKRNYLATMQEDVSILVSLKWIKCVHCAYQISSMLSFVKHLWKHSHGGKTCPSCMNSRKPSHDCQRIVTVVAQIKNDMTMKKGRGLEFPLVDPRLFPERQTPVFSKTCDSDLMICEEPVETVVIEDDEDEEVLIVEATRGNSLTSVGSTSSSSPSVNSSLPVSQNPQGTCEVTTSMTRDSLQRIINMSATQRVFSGKTEYYLCQFCSFSSITSGGYELHLRLQHSEEQVYVCYVCQEECTSIDWLLQHLDIHISLSSGNFLACQHASCSKEFDSLHFYVGHQRLTHPRWSVHECRCGRKLNSLDEFTEHFSKGIAVFHCGYCSALSLVEDVIQSHMKELHRSLNPLIKRSFILVCWVQSAKMHRREMEKRRRKMGSQFVKSKTAKCETCSLVLPNIESLLYHSAFHGKKLSHANSLWPVFSKPDSSARKLCSCPRCPERFHTMDYLVDHLACHTNPTALTSYGCKKHKDFRTTDRKVFLQHVRSPHQESHAGSSEKDLCVVQTQMVKSSVLTCPLCDYLGFDRRTLDLHRQQVHALQRAATDSVQQLAPANSSDQRVDPGDQGGNAAAAAPASHGMFHTLQSSGQEVRSGTCSQNGPPGRARPRTAPCSTSSASSHTPPETESSFRPRILSAKHSKTCARSETDSAGQRNGSRGVSLGNLPSLWHPEVVALSVRPAPKPIAPRPDAVTALNDLRHVHQVPQVLPTPVLAQGDSSKTASSAPAQRPVEAGHPPPVGPSQPTASAAATTQNAPVLFSGLCIPVTALVAPQVGVANASPYFAPYPGITSYVPIFAPTSCHPSGDSQLMSTSVGLPTVPGVSSSAQDCPETSASVMVPVCMSPQFCQVGTGLNSNAVPLPPQPFTQADSSMESGSLPPGRYVLSSGSPGVIAGEKQTAQKQSSNGAQLASSKIHAKHFPSLPKWRRGVLRMKGGKMKKTLQAAPSSSVLQPRTARMEPARLLAPAVAAALQSPVPLSFGAHSASHQKHRMQHGPQVQSPAAPSYSSTPSAAAAPSDVAPQCFPSGRNSVPVTAWTDGIITRLVAAPPMLAPSTSLSHSGAPSGSVQLVNSLAPSCGTYGSGIGSSTNGSILHTHSSSLTDGRSAVPPYSSASYGLLEARNVSQESSVAPPRKDLAGAVMKTSEEDVPQSSPNPEIQVLNACSIPLKAYNDLDAPCHFSQPSRLTPSQERTQSGKFHAEDEGSGVPHQGTLKQNPDHRNPYVSLVDVTFVVPPSGTVKVSPDLIGKLGKRKCCVDAGRLLSGEEYPEGETADLQHFHPKRRRLHDRDSGQKDGWKTMDHGAPDLANLRCLYTGQTKVSSSQNGKKDDGTNGNAPSSPEPENFRYSSAFQSPGEKFTKGKCLICLAIVQGPDAAQLIVRHLVDRHGVSKMYLRCAYCLAVSDNSNRVQAHQMKCHPQKTHAVLMHDISLPLSQHSASSTIPSNSDQTSAGSLAVDERGKVHCLSDLPKLNRCLICGFDFCESKQNPPISEMMQHMQKVHSSHLVKCVYCCASSNEHGGIHQHAKTCHGSESSVTYHVSDFPPCRGTSASDFLGIFKENELNSEGMTVSSSPLCKQVESQQDEDMRIRFDSASMSGEEHTSVGTGLGAEQRECVANACDLSPAYASVSDDDASLSLSRVQHSDEPSASCVKGKLCDAYVDEASCADRSWQPAGHGLSPTDESAQPGKENTSDGVATTWRFVRPICGQGIMERDAFQAHVTTCGSHPSHTFLCKQGSCSLAHRTFSVAEDYYTHVKAAHNFSVAPSMKASPEVLKKVQDKVLDGRTVAQQLGVPSVGNLIQSSGTLLPNKSSAQSSSVLKYACSQCRRRVTSRFAFQRHLAKHHQFHHHHRACDCCSFVTGDPLSLAQHRKEVHALEHYRCERCSYESPQLKQLRAHYKDHKDFPEGKQFIDLDPQVKVVDVLRLGLEALGEFMTRSKICAISSHPHALLPSMLSLCEDEDEAQEYMGSFAANK